MILIHVRPHVTQCNAQTSGTASTYSGTRLGTVGCKLQVAGAPGIPCVHIFVPCFYCFLFLIKFLAIHSHIHPKLLPLTAIAVWMLELLLNSLRLTPHRWLPCPLPRQQGLESTNYLGAKIHQKFIKNSSKIIKLHNIHQSSISVFQLCQRLRPSRWGLRPVRHGMLFLSVLSSCGLARKKRKHASDPEPRNSTCATRGIGSLALKGPRPMRFESGAIPYGS